MGRSRGGHTSCLSWTLRWTERKEFQKSFSHRYCVIKLYWRFPLYSSSKLQLCIHMDSMKAEYFLLSVRFHKTFRCISDVSAAVGVWGQEGFMLRVFVMNTSFVIVDSSRIIAHIILLRHCYAFPHPPIYSAPFFPLLQVCNFLWSWLRGVTKY